MVGVWSRCGYACIPHWSVWVGNLALNPSFLLMHILPPANRVGELDSIPSSLLRPGTAPQPPAQLQVLWALREGTSRW